MAGGAECSRAVSALPVLRLLTIACEAVEEEEEEEEEVVVVVGIAEDEGPGDACTATEGDRTSEGEAEAETAAVPGVAPAGDWIKQRKVHNTVR